MNLSLSYCPSLASSVASPVALWSQLNATSGSQPALFGHHALTTVFEKTEWMIITGGESHKTKGSSPRFNVWLMNLTHADLFGEENWFTMKGGKDGSSGSACTPFVYNATSDPWDRSDLWQQSVKCAPTPRREHLAAVVNDDLFVFQGYVKVGAKQDFGVYRISLSEVLTNKWNAWRRIMPRELLNSTSTIHAPIKGGLWHRKTEKQLPRLVAFANRPHGVEANHQSWSYGSVTATLNQVWTYDFSEDSWELWYEESVADFNTGDYSAIVVRQALLIVGTGTNGDSPLFWVDLESKNDGFSWQVEDLIVPRQSLVAYDDARTEQSVIVGFGPEQNYFARHRASNLALASLTFDDDDNTVNAPPVRIDDSINSPAERTGHSALLSVAGNMYIFGGFDVTEDADTLWRINVGGQDCSLNHHTSGGNYDRYNNFYFDDAFSDDDQQEDDGSGFIMFIFIFIQLGLCFVGSNRRHRPGGQAGAGVASLRGLTPEQLETFPQRVLCEGDDHLGENNVCSICLLEFGEGHEVRDLPCKHFFHKECVDDWLLAEITCPLCRVSCRPAVEARESEQASPSRALTIRHWLSRDHREAIESQDDNIDDGLEMNSIYSLELQEQDGDDVSILSTTTNASVVSIGQQPSSEATIERRERRRRRTLLRGGGGERAVPLTASEDSAMV